MSQFDTVHMISYYYSIRSIATMALFSVVSHI